MRRTYKQMTKELECIDKQIQYMYTTQKRELNSGDISKSKLCGDIINNLCCYKNFLIYEKQYETVDISNEVCI